MQYTAQQILTAQGCRNLAKNKSLKTKRTHKLERSRQLPPLAMSAICSQRQITNMSMQRRQFIKTLPKLEVSCEKRPFCTKLQKYPKRWSARGNCPRWSMLRTQLADDQYKYMYVYAPETILRGLLGYYGLHCSYVCCIFIICAYPQCSYREVFYTTGIKHSVVGIIYFCLPFLSILSTISR